MHNFILSVLVGFSAAAAVGDKPITVNPLDVPGEFKLQCNKKLADIKWKDHEFWMLTKPMNDSDVAETYNIKYSVIIQDVVKSKNPKAESTLVVIEKKCATQDSYPGDQPPGA